MGFRLCSFRVWAFRVGFLALDCWRCAFGVALLPLDVLWLLSYGCFPFLAPSSFQTLQVRQSEWQLEKFLIQKKTRGLLRLKGNSGFVTLGLNVLSVHVGLLVFGFSFFFRVDISIRVRIQGGL